MTYQEQRFRLIQYLRMKIEQEDWHGVADAANDLRELDAYQLGLTSKSPVELSPWQAAGN